MTNAESEFIITLSNIIEHYVMLFLHLCMNLFIYLSIYLFQNMLCNALIELDYIKVREMFSSVSRTVIKIPNIMLNST